MQYKVHIEDRDYMRYRYVNVESSIPVDLPISPGLSKLFDCDEFIISDNNKKINIVHSPIRGVAYLSGVLILEKNKTYGRTQNKKRLLYKCIPSDRRLPSFLLPYELKIDFTKIFKNKYVVFKYHHWEDKHPHGILSETLGDVDSNDAFYEYQLYSKNLHYSIAPLTQRLRTQTQSFSDLSGILQQIAVNFSQYPELSENPYIFTIDPKGSMDLDDAFSIESVIGGNYKITIYIAHVCSWLNELDLWDTFASCRRVSTIYLPQKRYTMLPIQLSDNLCSLLEGNARPVFCLEILVDYAGNLVSEPVYKNRVVVISKNYHYDDPFMLNQDSHYRSLFELTKKMDSCVKDSHEMVEFWMILMNKHCAEYLYKKRTGIFRSVSQTITEPIEPMEHDILKKWRQWRNTTSQYVLYNDDIALLRHDALCLDTYIHITSPIRRRVDVINQLLICITEGMMLNVSESAIRFIDSALKDLVHVNVDSKNIRKIQSECDILHRVFNDPDIANNGYSGVVFDCRVASHKITYLVYLAELNYIGKVHFIPSLKPPIELYATYKFRIFLFKDEYHSRKKIRLELWV